MALKAVTLSESPLSRADRLLAYRVGLRVRAAITQCLVEMRKGAVRFWIGGPGEEVHGAATALAMHHFDAEVSGKEWTTALFPHYRSDALVSLLSELRGHPDFTRDYFRQALSRATDPMSRGRQMVMHVCDPARGIMPVQSPLGMNLGKAAGYAKGRAVLDLPGVTVAVSGDGTTATSDFHEAFTAASVWSLPLLVIVTDNRIAISVKPEEGRGIKDFEAYSRGFGGGFFHCDGADLDATYRTTLEALRWCRDHRRPCLLHTDVPRLRGHSSSDGAVFSYDKPDPLILLSERLHAEGVIEEADRFLRKDAPAERDYFEDHVLGRLMEAERDRVRATLDAVRKEPAPEPGDEALFAQPDFPRVTEPESGGTSAVQVNEALNLCLHRMVAEGRTAAWGQDMAGDKGGVFKVTRGLSQKWPDRVQNAPINEPLIVGTALGAAHHPGFRVIPEIQFGDYALNVLHWLVHAGNLYWGSGGRLATNVILRTPVDPVQGGALYHSMTVDGFFTPVGGWVIVCPSTSFDAYGLLRTAGDYAGPVLFLEPKLLYRRALGPALPGEPDGGAVRAARRASGESLLSAGDLTAVADFRVPLGVAAERRSGGDLTLVSWSSAAVLALEAAEALEREGIRATVLDLRTLVPWDVERVVASVRATGRLLVVQNDRTGTSLGRAIQGTVHERLESIASSVVGMRDVPAIGMARELEEHTAVTPARIAAAARDLVRRQPGAFVQNEDAWLRFAPTRRRI